MFAGCGGGAAALAGRRARRGAGSYAYGHRHAATCAERSQQTAKEPNARSTMQCPKTADLGQLWRKCWSRRVAIVFEALAVSPEVWEKLFYRP
jgi:hypothetical protein